MSVEEKLQQILGAQIITICNLQTQLDDVVKRLAAFEKPAPAATPKVVELDDNVTELDERRSN